MNDRRNFEPSDDELRDDEYPDDELDDDSSLTVPCVQCGAEIYEDAVQCPVCGTYLPAGEGRSGRKAPWWLWLVVGATLLGLLATLIAT